jgi:hypothetical protein
MAERNVNIGIGFTPDLSKVREELEAFAAKLANDPLKVSFSASKGTPTTFGTPGTLSTPAPASTHKN